MTSSSRTIVDVIWFTGRDCIGVVKVDDSWDGIKYYIGAGKGQDEEWDAQYIADWGSHLPNSAGEALFGPIEDKKSQLESASSWNGAIDRQSGAFTQDEIDNATQWK